MTMTFNAPMTYAELVKIARANRVDLLIERGVRVAMTQRVIVDDESFGIYDATSFAYLGRCIAW